MTSSLMSAKTILSLCNGEYSFIERTANDPEYKEHLSKKISIPPLPISRNYLQSSPRRSPFLSCRD